MRMKPAHPGLLLAEQFETLDLKILPTAKILGISRQQLHRILKGEAPVTPDLAVKVGHMFANGPDLWLNMQSSYDAWMADEKLADMLKKIPVYTLRPNIYVREPI